MPRSARSPVKRREWVGGEYITFSRTTTGTSEDTIATAAALNVYTRPTIMRLRGNLIVSLSGDMCVTTSDYVLYTLGIWIEDDAATTPPPIETAAGTLRSYPWIWFGAVGMQQLPVGIGSPAACVSEAYQSAFSFERIVVDSKAMRKVDPDQKIMMLFGVSQISAGSVIAVNGQVRALIQE